MRGLVQRCLFAAAAAFLGLIPTSEAYVADVVGHFPVGQTPVLTLEFGPTGAGTFQDGSTSFYQIFESAVGEWNGFLNDKLTTVEARNFTPGGRFDGTNEIFFASDIYGQPFTSLELAVTTEVDSSRGIRIEGDIDFNQAVTWDSYRGNLQYPQTDFYRVALHEMGHLLGLDHPDEFNQTVQAVMNSVISNSYRLQADDVLGAQSIHGVAAPFPFFQLTASGMNAVVFLNPSPSAQGYARDTNVTLTASPHDGYKFDRWSGTATSILNPWTVPVASDMNVVATTHSELVEVASGGWGGPSIKSQISTLKLKIKKLKLKLRAGHLTKAAAARLRRQIKVLVAREYLLISSQG